MESLIDTLRTAAPWLAFIAVALALIVWTIVRAYAYALEQSWNEDETGMMFGAWPADKTPFREPAQETIDGETSLEEFQTGAAELPSCPPVTTALTFLPSAADRVILGLGVAIVGVEAFFFLMPASLLAMLPGGGS